MIEHWSERPAKSAVSLAQMAFGLLESISSTPFSNAKFDYLYDRFIEEMQRLKENKDHK